MVPLILILFNFNIWDFLKMDIAESTITKLQRAGKSF